MLPLYQCCNNCQCCQLSKSKMPPTGHFSPSSSLSSSMSSAVISSPLCLPSQAQFRLLGSPWWQGRSVGIVQWQACRCILSCAIPSSLASGQPCLWSTKYAQSQVGLSTEWHHWRYYFQDSGVRSDLSRCLYFICHFVWLPLNLR